MWNLMITPDLNSDGTGSLDYAGSACGADDRFPGGQRHEG